MLLQYKWMSYSQIWLTNYLSIKSTTFTALVIYCQTIINASGIGRMLQNETQLKESQSPTQKVHGLYVLYISTTLIIELL